MLVALLLDSYIKEHIFAFFILIAEDCSVQGASSPDNSERYNPNRSPAQGDERGVGLIMSRHSLCQVLDCSQEERNQEEEPHEDVVVSMPPQL